MDQRMVITGQIKEILGTGDPKERQEIDRKVAERPAVPGPIVWDSAEVFVGVKSGDFYFGSQLLACFRQDHLNALLHVHDKSLIEKYHFLEIFAHTTIYHLFYDFLWFARLPCLIA